MTGETNPTTPPWCQVGSRVVVVRTRRGVAESAKFTTIDRIGKRDVVCADATRVRVRDLRAPSSGQWDTSSTYLVEPGADETLAMLDDLRARIAREKARYLCDNFSRNRDDAPEPTEVIRALAKLLDDPAPFLALLNEIEAEG